MMIFTNFRKMILSSILRSSPWKVWMLPTEAGTCVISQMLHFTSSIFLKS